MKKNKILTLFLVAIMFTSLVTPMNKVEARIEGNTEPGTDYLTAEDLLQRYINVAGGLGQTQNYNFDYGKDAPVYDQLSLIRFTQTASAKIGGYALDAQGKVWSWGYNISGRAGVNQTAEQQRYHGGLRRIPYFVDKNINIVKIAAGYETGYALSDKGKVYAWGRGLEGQMGNGTNSLSNLSPVEVQIPNEIVDFYPAKANQAHHVAAVDINGDVWMWGYADNGRIPNAAGYLSKPKKVTSLSANEHKFIKVAPGDNYTLALADDGTVWSMGNGVYGALGNGRTAGITREFNKIETLSNIVAIDSSYSRNVALDSNGNVYEWGQIFGRAGAGAYRSISTPEKVEIAQSDIDYVGYTPIAKKVFAGESVSFFIDQKGRTWAWGDGRYFGQSREGGYEDSNDVRTKEAYLYPRIIGDGDTQIYDRSEKFPKYVTETNSKIANGKLGYGFNTLHPTAWDEVYMLKDKNGVVLDSDHNQLEYKNGYYYKKGTKEKGMPAIDPKETWIDLTFQQPGYMYDISTERSSSVFLDLSGNIFKTSNDGSGSIAWGWDYDDKYFTYNASYNNKKVGIADSYVYEFVYMRGLPTKTEPVITKPEMENVKIYKNDPSYRALEVKLTAQVPEQIKDDNLGLVIDSELESVDWVFVPYDMENPDAVNLNISGETKKISDPVTGIIKEVKSEFDELMEKTDADGALKYKSGTIRDGEAEPLKPGEREIPISVEVEDNGILFVRSSFNQYGTSNGTVSAVIVDNFYTKAPIVHNGVGNASNFEDYGGVKNIPVYANTNDNVVKTNDDSEDTKLDFEESKKLIGFPLDVKGEVINSKPILKGNEVIKDIEPTFGYDVVEVSSYEADKFEKDGWNLLDLDTGEETTEIQKYPAITLDDKQDFTMIDGKIEEVEYVFNYRANSNVLSEILVEALDITEDAVEKDEHYAYIRVSNANEEKKGGRFFIFSKEYAEDSTRDKKPIDVFDPSNLLGVFESESGVLDTRDNEEFYNVLAAIHGGDGNGKIMRNIANEENPYPIEAVFQEGPITIDEETGRPMDFGPGQKLLSDIGLAKVVEKDIGNLASIEITRVDSIRILFTAEEGSIITIYDENNEVIAIDEGTGQKQIIRFEEQDAGSELTIIVEAKGKVRNVIVLTVD